MSLSRFLFPAIVAVTVLSSAAPGQGLASAQSVSTQLATVPGTHRITVDLKAVPLDVAVRTVAAEAGLQVVYNDALIPKKFVSLKAENVTAADAFTRILTGTGLGFQVSPSGVVSVVPSLKTDRKLGVGVITGKVVDTKNGKAISGATVSISGDNRGSITDEDGSFRFSGVSTGLHTVTVRMVGYAKQTRSVTVGEGATITADFKLEPSANVLDQVVVTGSVVATELKAIPNAITVITAKQIEERGITKITQLFRGDVPGLFAVNQGSVSYLDEVTMFSRGATALSNQSTETSYLTNAIKTYVDGIELADSRYISQIDPKTIARIEILSGPQASTIYGSNALNGVMQIFTKRGTTSHPQLTLSLMSGWVENNFSTALTPQHDYNSQMSGVEGRLSYNASGSWNYMGQWTPAKQTARINVGGGTRLDTPTRIGNVVLDLTLQRTRTRNAQRGTDLQGLANYWEQGWYNVTSTTGLTSPTIYTYQGQTLGLALTYAPKSWWSHELGMGQDVTTTGKRYTAAGYRSRSDTSVTLDEANLDRRSIRYTTTVRSPLGSVAQITATVGGDGWQSLQTNMSAQGPALVGSVNTYYTYRQPRHNAGGFVQTQLAMLDRLFLTYGLRAEWNPRFGDEVVPNYAPRYGAAFTQELGSLTAKLRASYGRSTRPPAPSIPKEPLSAKSIGWDFAIPDYGNFNFYLGNPELAPEYQQGGEGGMELYFGTRGALVVTRYNQTVDGLIAAPKVDSVRSLTTFPTSIANSYDTDGYGYVYQYQNLNIGSIRNQGWELQGSVNTGPFTTRGTYSWTKSRTIGVTPKYRPVLGAGQYRPGATFIFLPEHTWALGTTYAHARSTIGINVMGAGRILNLLDKFSAQYLSDAIRLPQNRMNISGSYVTANAGYAMADVNVTHRLTQGAEGVLQVQNVGNTYTNDYYATNATLGRQTKLGLRVRF